MQIVFQLEASLIKNRYAKLQKRNMLTETYGIFRSKQLRIFMKTNYTSIFEAIYQEIYARK